MPRHSVFASAYSNLTMTGMERFRKRRKTVKKLERWQISVCDSDLFEQLLFFGTAISSSTVCRRWSPEQSWLGTEVLFSFAIIEFSVFRIGCIPYLRSCECCWMFLSLFTIILFLFTRSLASILKIVVPIKTSPSRMTLRVLVKSWK